MPIALDLLNSEYLAQQFNTRTGSVPGETFNLPYCLVNVETGIAG